jgi:3-hydroxyisobutyrate dehydrogenase
MTIGYIGLGTMGGALASRLQLKRQLVVFDTNPSAVKRLEAEGAQGATSAGAVARSCDMILLCLPKSAHVRAAIFDEGGILSTARAGTLIIDQTTGDPSVTREMAAELARHQVELIDAPVSGGPNGAKAGRIAMMVGASNAQYQRILPVLQDISPNIFHAGETGTGQVVKLANNLLHHSQRLLSLEVLSLAVRNGLDPSRAVDILLASSGRNYFLEHNMHPRILAGELVSGFTLDLLYKDVSLATSLGESSGVPMPITNLIRELYRFHLNDLGGNTQVNTIANTIDRLAGTSIVGSGLN